MRRRQRPPRLAAVPRPAIYPLFLAQAGCPFCCVYCDQAHITGVPAAPDPAADRLQRLHALARSAREQDRPGELAFYGGTFTLLPRGERRELLEAARQEMAAGAFTALRCSTRPDAVDAEILAELAPFPLRTIELGVQSLSDRVLRAVRRGYTAAQARRGVSLVKEHGYRVGIQLMVGLPGERAEDFRTTVAAAVALAPDLVRIYPTLVLKGTVLAAWYARGRYRPLSLDQALERVCDAYEAFRRAHIAVARMGLHGDPKLLQPGVVVAGPWHPGFGHRVKALWWRRQLMLALASRSKVGATMRVRVPARQWSEVVGPHRENIEWLCRQLQLGKLEVLADGDLAADRWRLEREGAHAAVCGFEEAV